MGAKISYYSFVTSLEYHSASQPSDQPDMKNRTSLFSLPFFLFFFFASECLIISLDPLAAFEISPASGQAHADWIWRGTPWLNIKKVWNLTFSLIYKKNKKWKIGHALGISWIMSFYFPLDLHPSQSFARRAITNCSIRKRSKCGSEATQLSMSIKLPPLTRLLSHQ